MAEPNRRTVPVIRWGPDIHQPTAPGLGSWRSERWPVPGGLTPEKIDELEVRVESVPGGGRHRPLFSGASRDGSRVFLDYFLR